ncbi:MAG: LptE family protein [Phycisphaerales bacterium]|nr:LptE family protein [Phycisphaerales bacterium]
MSGRTHASRAGRLRGAGMAIAAGVVALAGCASNPTEGYSTEPPFPANVQTVSVSIFENKTYVRDIQFDIADALIKKIESTTPYKVTGAGFADTSMTGRITNVTLRQLSKSTATGLAEEDVLVVTVDFEWRDLRTGQPIVERRGFTADGLFVPSRPSSEPIDLGRFAAAQALATDIVGEMRSTW